MPELVYFSNETRLFEMADRLFSEVEARLRVLLPQSEILHVGSTAVRGSMTKGDLDVAVRIEQGGFRDAEEVLAQEYDRNTGSERTDDFAAFVGESTVPELGIQLVAVGGSADTFHIWVQQLLDDPTLRRKYDELKLGFDGLPMQEYRSAKSAFIAKHIQQ